MTNLIIDGKEFMPNEHTIVGYKIIGAEQSGNTITKLILVSTDLEKGI